MNTHTYANHYLIVITPEGTIRGEVVVVELLGLEGASLVIEIQDILPVGDYDAVYETPFQAAPGIFKVFYIQVSQHSHWQASGIFTRTKEQRKYS